MFRKRRLLIGLHDDLVRRTYNASATLLGWNVEEASGLEEMLEKMNGQRFDAYVMDANLGRPGVYDVSPAKEVYGLVKDKVEGGTARYAAISAKREVADICKEEGVPGHYKMEFDLLKFLNS